MLYVYRDVGINLIEDVVYKVEPNGFNSAMTRQKSHLIHWKLLCRNPLWWQFNISVLIEERKIIFQVWKIN